MFDNTEDPLELDNVDRIAMPARALFLIGQMHVSWTCELDTWDTCMLDHALAQRWGPDKRNRLTILYPATTGRNFSEVLRAIDSLHITQVGPEARKWKNMTLRYAVMLCVHKSRIVQTQTSNEKRRNSWIEKQREYERKRSTVWFWFYGIFELAPQLVKQQKGQY